MAVLLSTGANLNNQELLNFKVENGETFVTTSNAYKAPLEGRMIYDKTERVMRFGYKDAQNEVVWGTFLTTANFDPQSFALKTNGELVHPTVYSNRPNDISPDGASLVIREVNLIGNVGGTVYNSQCPRIGFNWSGKWWGQIIFAANTFKLVRGANDNNWAHFQAGNIRGASVGVFDGTASQFMKADGTLDSRLYDEFVEYTGKVINSAFAPQAPTSGMVLRVAFNKNTRSFCVIVGNPNVAEDKQETKVWIAEDNMTVTGTSNTVRDFQKTGTCISVDGDIYRYNGSEWRMVYHGVADTGYDARITKIENALLLDETKDNVINSWKEVVDFLKTVDGSSDLAAMLKTMNDNIAAKPSSTQVGTMINNAIAGKADKTEVITKPSTNGNDGDILTVSRNLNGTEAVWKKHKIVEKSEDDYGNTKIVNHEWIINIEVLNTADVTVCLYRRCSDGSFEMILADVRICNVDTEDGRVMCCKITFCDEGDDLYKAVITA